MFDRGNRFGVHGDAVARQALAQPALDGDAVGADDDVRAPRFQTEREPGHSSPAAVRREAAIAPLPPVTVRAMKDRAPVAFIESRDRWKIVDDAGREEEIAGALVRAVRKGHAIQL